MQLHPDRNPSADAAARFHEVNIAYEILIGERKAPIYKRANPFRQKPTQAKPQQETSAQKEERIREERIKAADARWKQRMEQEAKELEQYTLAYKQFRKGLFFRIASITFLFWGLIGLMNIADQFLPLRYHEHKVLSYQTYGGALFGVEFSSMVFKTETYARIVPGKTMTVGQSYLLSNPVELLVYFDDLDHSFSPLYIYKPYEGGKVLGNDDQIFLPFVFLMAGLIFVFYRKPFPVVHFFFWLAVIIVNVYGLWYFTLVGNRIDLFLKLFG